MAHAEPGTVAISTTAGDFGLLKALVRVAVVFVVLFVSLIAALMVTVTQDAFPRNTQYSISLDFTKASGTKADAISALNEIAGRGVYLAKVSPDPKHFYTVRDLFVFGLAAPERAEPADWFAPGLGGSILPASQLGNGSLNGPYVMSGSAQQVQRLVSWASSAGVRADLSERSDAQILVVALVDTGAWLALVTVLVLLISMVITWYAMRARARTLRALAGQRTLTILLGDVSSLLYVALLPAVATLALASVVVAVACGIVNVPSFWGQLAPFLIATVGVLLLCAVIVGTATLPRVDKIASRAPSERPYRVVSEVVRVAAVVLTLVFLPSVGVSASAAFALSDAEARWAPLAQDVSVRSAARDDAEANAHLSEFSSLAAAADKRGSLLLSYNLDGYLPPGSSNDGLVLTNPAYVKAMASQMSLHPQKGNPFGPAGAQVTLSQLPKAVSATLRESFKIWTKGAGDRFPVDGSVTIFRYTGTQPFPVIDPGDGELRLLSSPLVVLVNEPSETFDSDFLSATMSTANVLFAEPEWLNHYLATHPVGAQISFVDRVSDVALNRAQAAMRQALMLTTGVLIVLLALLMSTAISTRIHAITHARAIFARRINGHSWAQILSKRVVIELTLIAALTLIAYALVEATGSSAAAWVLLAFPIYGGTTLAFHRNAARSVFETIAQRRT